LAFLSHSPILFPPPFHLTRPLHDVQFSAVPQLTMIGFIQAGGTWRKQASHDGSLFLFFFSLFSFFFLESRVSVLLSHLGRWKIMLTGFNTFQAADVHGKTWTTVLSLCFLVVGSFIHFFLFHSPLLRTCHGVEPVFTVRPSHSEGLALLSSRTSLFRVLRPLDPLLPNGYQGGRSFATKPEGVLSWPSIVRLFQGETPFFQADSYKRAYRGGIPFLFPSVGYPLPPSFPFFDGRSMSVGFFLNPPISFFSDLRSSF